MSRPNYKLLTWNDYSIPVPLWANWLAMDKDRQWYVFDGEPYVSVGFESWRPPLGKDIHKPLLPFEEYFETEAAHLDPPEPGPWHQQLYWIG